MERKRRARLANTILGAVAVDFAVRIVADALAEPGQRPQLPTTAGLVSFAVVALLFFLIGIYLGKRVWPRRGRKLALYLMRRAMQRKKGHILFVTDRPDVPISTTRRIVEVVAFAAGTTVILAYILAVAEFHPGIVLGSSALLALVAVWGSFVLVPYWVFGRMGLRQVDVLRWLVQPMSRRYADRLQLSNGALLLVALGAAFNLAFRAGASRNAALLEGVKTIADTTAVVLVAAATAVALFNHDEHALVRDIEREAIAMGLHDGRGMSDGDFLPRLPQK